MKTWMVALALLATQDEKGLKTWSGTVDVEAAKQLPGNSFSVDGTALSVACFQRADAWKAFAKAAGSPLPEEPALDWSKRAVVVVLYRECTNRLEFVSWTDPKEGVAELRFNWSKVEIGHVDAVPVVIHPFDLKDVKEIRISCTVDGKGAKPLGTLPLTVTAAEDLLRAVEEKAAGAKSLRFRGTLRIDVDAENQMELKAEGRIKGDKVKLTVSGEIGGKEGTSTFVCDGSRARVETTGSMGRESVEGVFDAPKNLGEGLRVALVRAGILVAMFGREKREREADFDVKGLTSVAKVTLAKDDVTDGVVRRVLHYTLKFGEGRDDASGRLWVDAMTLKPVKHEIEVHGMTIEQTFSTWRVDEEMKDEEFDLKK